MSFTSSTGGTWSFVYDTTAGIPAVIEEVLPSTSSVYYIREPNGALIARVAGETVNYYHFDALGSARLLTDASGAVTDEYTYDAWGTLTNHTEHTGSVDQPYQYVGRRGYYTHYQDPNLLLLQTGIRFYDPPTARFTQTDPLRDMLSNYSYVGGNPIRRIDPWGLTWYDGWLDGSWGMKIPGLGDLWYNAGEAWGNAQYNGGSWGSAIGQTALAGGAVVGTAFGALWGAEFVGFNAMYAMGYEVPMTAWGPFGLSSTILGRPNAWVIIGNGNPLTYALTLTWAKWPPYPPWNYATEILDSSLAQPFSGPGAWLHALMGHCIYNP